MNTDITPAANAGELAPREAVSEATGRLIADSTAPNTRRAYRSALKRLDAFLDGRPATDSTLAEYLGAMDEAGAAPSTASVAIAAVKFRSRLREEPSPAGPLTERALAGFQREGRAERGRGRAPSLDLDALAEIAGQCGPRDRAIVLTLFQACLRRSEAAALEWRDIETASIPNALRIHVRTSKTNKDGEPDYRLVKNGAARALLAIRPEHAEPRGSVFGLSGQSIGRRFAAAAKRAGYEGVTAHSARRTYAAELTRLGASAVEVMLAGGWKTPRMVAHYASGAAAEVGATAKYL